MTAKRKCQCGMPMRCLSIVPPWDVWVCSACEVRPPPACPDDGWWTPADGVDFTAEEPTQPQAAPLVSACPGCGSRHTSAFMGKMHCWACGRVF